MRNSINISHIAKFENYTDNENPVNHVAAKAVLRESKFPGEVLPTPARPPDSKIVRWVLEPSSGSLLGIG